MKKLTEKSSKPRTSPRDFFLHLLAMITLYMSAISFLALVFQIINTMVPDLAEFGQYYNHSSSRFGTMRFAIASLLVVFPTYIGVSWYLEKLYRLHPEKRMLGIRKWLIYLTLFVASLIIIGDWIALINGLLGGELKIRFLLKAVSILFASGSVFYYYLTDIRKFKIE
ncbi:MAG: DUF5671 domain-containing protein [bacterium]|nr:DUF5671 domain-containing protein [bacterium]